MYEWEDIKTAVELTKKGLSINDIKKFLDYEQEPVICLLYTSDAADE